MSIRPTYGAAQKSCQAHGPTNVPHTVKVRQFDASFDVGPGQTILDAALAADRVALVHVRIDPKAARAGGANYLQ